VRDGVRAARDIRELTCDGFCFLCTWNVIRAGLILAHLCNHHITILIVSTHSVSIRSLSIAADDYGRHVPDVVDILVQLPLQQSGGGGGDGVGIIRVFHWVVYWE